MIISSMSLSEVAATLREDVVELQRHLAEKHWELEKRHRKSGKGVLVEVGEFTSTDQVQWVYVVTISTSKTVLYPLGWYFTREGIHAFQIDAEGPATYLRPHVLDRYRKRYFPDADVLGALRRMHNRNYDKASEPRLYRGKPGIASAIEDGYILGDVVYGGTVMDYHTFYDVEMCGKEPALRGMRKLLEWRRYFTATTLKISSNQPDNYVNWGQGFPIRLERLRRAA